MSRVPFDAFDHCVQAPELAIRPAGLVGWMRQHMCECRACEIYEVLISLHAMQNYKLITGQLICYFPHSCNLPCTSDTLSQMPQLLNGWPAAHVKIKAELRISGPENNQTPANAIFFLIRGPLRGNAAELMAIQQNKHVHHDL